MKRRAFVSSLAAWPMAAAAAPTSEEGKIRAIAEAFLREHGIQGMSIAYGRDGKIDFEAGYGFADADGTEVVTPQHRFRIASISKPITATALMMCIEKGLIQPDTKVFGPQSILGGDYSGDVAAVTVDHLLTHTSGGWANDKDDPMFKNPQMEPRGAHRLDAGQSKTNPQARRTLRLFKLRLLRPGPRIGKSAENATRRQAPQELLTKCGITSMQIAGNTLAERQPQEVMYLTPKPGAAYSMNVTRMDSHGGWIATASDLVRFASQLPTLLNPDSIRAMTTHGISEGYARGWNVNNVPNWWHTGSLPGTTTIMVHTSKGFCGWLAQRPQRKARSRSGQADVADERIGEGMKAVIATVCQFSFSQFVFCVHFSPPS